MTADIEPNECQLSDGRSPTSNRGETPESERTRKDSSDVSLTDRPRRQRRPPGYLQDFLINQTKIADLSATTEPSFAQLLNKGDDVGYDKTTDD